MGFIQRAVLTNLLSAGSRGGGGVVVRILFLQVAVGSSVGDGYPSECLFDKYF